MLSQRREPRILQRPAGAYGTDRRGARERFGHADGIAEPGEDLRLIERILRTRGGERLRLDFPSGARVGVAEKAAHLRSRRHRFLKRGREDVDRVVHPPLVQPHARDALAARPEIVRQPLARLRRFVVPVQRREHVREIEVDFRRQRIGARRDPQVPQRLFQPRARPEPERREVPVGFRAARRQLDRPAEAALRVVPPRVARERHPHRHVRFRQQWIQLDRFRGRRAHPRRFVRRVLAEPARSDGACFGDGGVRRRESGILRHCFVELVGACLIPGHADVEFGRARAQIEIIGLDARLVPAPPASEVQAEVVDDAERDFVLDGEDVGQLAIEPARPDGRVVGDVHQLHVDPHLLIRAQHRSFQHVVGRELASDFADVARVPLEREG